MGLLDGQLQQIFGSAFGPLLLDGIIHSTTRTDDGQGGYISGVAVQYPCKLFSETYSDFFRTQSGIPDTDIRIIALQLDVGYQPTTDDEVEMQGRRYKIMAIEVDPAKVTWTFRGRPI